MTTQTQNHGDETQIGNYNPCRPIYPELRICRISLQGKKRTVFWHTYYRNVHIYGHYEKDKVIIDGSQEEPEFLIPAK